MDDKEKPPNRGGLGAGDLVGGCRLPDDRFCRTVGAVNLEEYSADIRNGVFATVASRTGVGISSFARAFASGAVHLDGDAQRRFLRRKNNGFAALTGCAGHAYASLVVEICNCDDLILV